MMIIMTLITMMDDDDDDDLRNRVGLADNNFEEGETKPSCQESLTRYMYHTLTYIEMYVSI